MHLLNTETFERVNVEEDLGQRPEFAILSHRWEGEEISFKSYDAAALRNDTFPGTNSTQRASASKIRGACTIARSQGLSYLWTDTCCIDKSSSEELRRALNSMFAWYSEAVVCYTYLRDVTFSQAGDRMFKSDSLERQRDSKPSEWFERGWTLQELLAPQEMEFYDKQWKFMGTRDHLAKTVGAIAGINPEYLEDNKSRSQKFREASVATKMSWMAGRVTRDVEDIAYSLLGIFNINMIPQYGEGVKAFARLQETLLADSASFDESLFAWTVPQNGDLRCYRRLKKHARSRPETIELVPKFEQVRWGLLAPSPDCFTTTRDVSIRRSEVKARLGAGFQRTQQGIYFELPLKETKSRWIGMDRKEVSLLLNCWRSEERINLELSRGPDKVWMRTDCTKCEPKKGAKMGSNNILYVSQSDVIVGTVTIAQPQLQLTYPDTS